MLLKQKTLLNEFQDIREQLEKLADEEKISELEKRTIIELSKRVVDNIAAKYRKISERVDQIMGGKVIETEAKRIYNRGVKQGVELGIEQGSEQGIINGKIELLYEEYNVPVSDIAKKVSKPEEYVKEVIKNLC